ncbi:MAG: hypothetical protein ACREJO_07005 [Phycisphaerales bacterium]
MPFNHRTSVTPAITALALLAAAAHASPTLIDFDNLPTSTLVTTQYPGVTFSSSAGENLYIDGGLPVSYPNYICTGASPSTIDCINDVYIDFASPVTNVSIWCVQPNEFGVVATVFAYNGATLLGTQNIIGLAAAPNSFGYGNVFVDLSSFGSLTRVEIRGPGGTGPIDNAAGGVGCAWDDLSYTIPAPGAAALLGLGMFASSKRRRV